MSKIYIIQTEGDRGIENVSSWTDESKAEDERKMLSEGNSAQRHWIQPLDLDVEASDRDASIKKGLHATRECGDSTVEITECYVRDFTDRTLHVTSFVNGVSHAWALTREQCMAGLRS